MFESGKRALFQFVFRPLRACFVTTVLEIDPNPHDHFTVRRRQPSKDLTPSPYRDRPLTCALPRGTALSQPLLTWPLLSRPQRKPSAAACPLASSCFQTEASFNLVPWKQLLPASFHLHLALASICCRVCPSWYGGKAESTSLIVHCEFGTVWTVLCVRPVSHAPNDVVPPLFKHV